MQQTALGRADLHMHTTASDGLSSVAALLDYVQKRGHLDVIAVTDHDTLEASLWAYHHRDQYSFDIIPGVEVTSTDGHVLGLWVKSPIAKGMNLSETVHAIHEQGGLAVLAHPFEMAIAPKASMRYLRNPEVLLEAGVDAVEVQNGGTQTPGNNYLARRLSRLINLPRVGNSDAHTLTAIGSIVTRFEGHTAEDLRHALARRATYVEGTLWPLSDYYTVCRAMIRRKLNASSAMKANSAHLTHP